MIPVKAGNYKAAGGDVTDEEIIGDTSPRSTVKVLNETNHRLREPHRELRMTTGIRCEWVLGSRGKSKSCSVSHPELSDDLRVALASSRYPRVSHQATLTAVELGPRAHSSALSCSS